MKKTVKKGVTIVLVFTIIISTISISSCSNVGWAVDAACTEVKRQLINSYGDVATVSGGILYENKPDFIVIVKYEIPELKCKGSIACHVYGYRKGNCYVLSTTDEMPYNYKYSRELMKTLWGIE